MDGIVANRIAAELAGKVVGGWTIRSSINHGKSAVVFEAERDGLIAALKVFDPEVVARFGRNSQLERINREKRLIGKRHPNVVEIIDGGECAETTHLFVAMQLLNAPNLGEVFKEQTPENTRRIISDVAKGAEFLESEGLVHRDIKPSNIAIMPDGSAVLLDLGVVRPLAGAPITDDAGRIFIGTLQYSSPEFLLRIEDGSVEGWRALTFYQIGAVLHDLLMKRRIFADAETPYGRLVLAVIYDDPLIDIPDAPVDLVLLAKHCLQKRVETRLQLVQWSHFHRQPTKDQPELDALHRIEARLQRLDTQPEERQTKYIQRGTLQAVRADCELIARSQCASIGMLPPFEIRKLDVEDEAARFRLFFRPSSRHSLQAPLSIQFTIRLIDLAARLIAVYVASFVGTPPDPPIDGDPIYHGVSDPGGITQSIRRAIVFAFDQAQQQKLSNPGESVTLDLRVTE